MADEGPTVRKMDDAEIVRKLKASDPEGMRALLEVHGPTVLANLRKKHGYHVAAEAVNRSALLIWVDFGSKYTEGLGSLGGWFLRIAQNKAIDIRRGETRRKFVQLDYDPSYDPSRCDDAAYKEEKAEDGQARERRKQATREIINNLPRVQRIVTECDSLDPNGEASIEVIRAALNNRNASNGSIYTARSKARKTICAEMIRLGFYASDAGRRKHG
jgi:DNA-directed RNA polymerase specialized sigma24 family protein